MQRSASITGAAALALALAGVTLIAMAFHSHSTSRVELAQSAPVHYMSQQQVLSGAQQLEQEYTVEGTAQTEEPPAEGTPLSFQFPIALPGPPPPPGPNVITIGPRPKKVPVCKKCEEQLKEIQVNGLSNPEFRLHVSAVTAFSGFQRA